MEVSRVVSIPQWLFEALIEREDAIKLLTELEATLEIRTEDSHEYKVDFN